MKKLVTLFVLAFSTIVINAQEEHQYKDVNHFSSDKVRYKLYPTFNMWTFLKLDTRTGAVNMVQYSIEGRKYEGSVYVGSPEISYSGDDAVNGRYELYPTSNIWTFLMIDQIFGYTYHVQWSNKKDGNNCVYAIF